MNGIILRNSLLAVTGLSIGLLLLALAPALLRQTSFDIECLRATKVRLTAMQQEEDLQNEKAEELEPLPELDQPEPPVMELPEMELPEIEAPETSYDPGVTEYTNTLSVPSLSAFGLQGVQVSPQSFSRRPYKVGLPCLPKHGKPATRYASDEVDKMPQPVAVAHPIYPYRAKRLGIEGIVRIRFLVNTSGKTEQLTILESKPSGTFDRAVKKTVKGWKYKPAVKDGREVETWVETTIRFKLS